MGDDDSADSSELPWLTRCHTTSADGNEATLRLSDAIAEGMTPAELYAQISDLIERYCVSWVFVPRYHRNVSDPSLWRVDPKGLYLRFSPEDPERLFTFESLSLISGKNHADRDRPKGD